MLLHRIGDRRFDPHQTRLAGTQSSTSQQALGGWLDSVHRGPHVQTYGFSLHTIGRHLLLPDDPHWAAAERSLFVSARHCGCESTCRWTRYMEVADDRHRLVVVAPTSSHGRQPSCFWHLWQLSPLRRLRLAIWHRRSLLCCLCLSAAILICKLRPLRHCRCSFFC